MHCTMFAVTAGTWVTFDTRWWCYCSKAAARHWKHWKNPQNACPAPLATRSCLCCPWEAEAARESGVGGCCHTVCACQGADTLAIDCDMSLTWSHAVLLQLGAQHRLARQQLQSVFLCMTDTPRGTRAWARPQISGFCTPIRRKKRVICLRWFEVKQRRILSLSSHEPW